jgi:hypothetical protein
LYTGFDIFVEPSPLLDYFQDNRFKFLSAIDLQCGQGTTKATEFGLLSDPNKENEISRIKTTDIADYIKGEKDPTHYHKHGLIPELDHAFARGATYLAEKIQDLFGDSGPLHTIGRSTGRFFNYLINLTEGKPEKEREKFIEEALLAMPPKNPVVLKRLQAKLLGMRKSSPALVGKKKKPTKKGRATREAFSRALTVGRKEGTIKHGEAKSFDPNTGVVGYDYGLKYTGPGSWAYTTPNRIRNDTGPDRDFNVRSNIRRSWQGTRSTTGSVLSQWASDRKKAIKSGRHTRAKAVPVGINYDYSSKNNHNRVNVKMSMNSMQITTKTLIGPISTLLKENIGYNLYKVNLNPNIQQLAGDRASRVASTFNFFKILKCDFKYEPARATTTSGNFYGAFTDDVMEVFSEDQEGLTQMLSKPGSHDCVFYASGNDATTHWSMPTSLKSKTKEYFNKSIGIDAADKRQSNQGAFYLKQGYAVDDESQDSVMGSLWCTMTVHFYGPTILPIAGTEGIFLPDFENFPTTFTLAVAVKGGRALPSAFPILDINSNEGVEFFNSEEIPTDTTEASAWKVQPGVWTCIVSLGNSVVSTTDPTSFSWQYFTPGGSWQAISTGNIATFFQTMHLQAGVNVTRGTCALRIVVPDDGKDYFISLLQSSDALEKDGKSEVLITPNAANDVTPTYTQARPPSVIWAYTNPVGDESERVASSLIAQMDDIRKRLQELERDRKINEIYKALTIVTDDDDYTVPRCITEGVIEEIRKSCEKKESKTPISTRSSSSLPDTSKPREYSESGGSNLGSSATVTKKR